MRAQEGRIHQQWEQAAAQCSQLQGQVTALQHTLLSPEASTQHLHSPPQSPHYSPAGETASLSLDNVGQWDTNEQHLPTYLSSQQHNRRCCIPSGGLLPLTYLLALRHKGRYHIANPFRRAQDTTQR